MNELHFLGYYFHVLAGIVWIGMLYYFNFVQTEYFKEAEAGTSPGPTVSPSMGRVEASHGR